jgi:hypothetical protein
MAHSERDTHEWEPSQEELERFIKSFPDVLPHLAEMAAAVENAVGAGDRETVFELLDAMNRPLDAFTQAVFDLLFAMEKDKDKQSAARALMDAMWERTRKCEPS